MSSGPRRMRDSSMPGSALSLNPLAENGQLVVNIEVDTMAIDAAIDSVSKDLLYTHDTLAGRRRPARIDPARQEDYRHNPQYHLKGGEIAFRARARDKAVSRLTQPDGGRAEDRRAIPARTVVSTLPWLAGAAVGAAGQKLAVALLHRQYEFIGPVKVPDSSQNLGGRALAIVQGSGTLRNNGPETIVVGDLVEAYFPTPDELQQGAGHTPEEKDGLRVRPRLRPYHPENNDPYNHALFVKAMDEFRTEWLAGDGANATGTAAYYAMSMRTDAIEGFWSQIFLARLMVNTVGYLSARAVQNAFDNSGLSAANIARFNGIMADAVILDRVATFRALSDPDKQLFSLGLFIQVVKSDFSTHVMPGFLATDLAYTDPTVWSAIYGAEMRALEAINTDTGMSRVLFKATSTAPQGESFDYLTVRHGH